MFAFLGLCLVFWLIVSPCWRIFALRNDDDSEELLLGGGARRQLNKWLVLWIVLSLLASICWIWFYAASDRYAVVDDAANVPWLWPHVDLYLWGVIIPALIFNLAFLIWLCFLDYNAVFLCSSIAAVVILGALIMLAIVLLIFCHQLHCADEASIILFHILGSTAAGVAFIANICRIMSVEVRDYSCFALSVALAGTVPELLWILNVNFMERGTAFDKDGHEIEYWDIFLKKNCHWKVAWTLNFLLRLPELALLLWWGAKNICQVLNDCAPIANFFKKNGQSESVEG